MSFFARYVARYAGNTAILLVLLDCGTSRFEREDEVEHQAVSQDGTDVLSNRDAAQNSVSADGGSCPSNRFRPEDCPTECFYGNGLCRNGECLKPAPGRTNGSVEEVLEPGIQRLCGNPLIFFDFIVPAAGILTLEINRGILTVVTEITETCLPADEFPCSTAISSVEMAVTTGQRYYIFVVGSAGPFTLEWRID